MGTLALVPYEKLSHTPRKRHCSIINPYRPYIGLFPLWAEVMKVHPIINEFIPLIPTNVLTLFIG